MSLYKTLKRKFDIVMKPESKPHETKTEERKKYTVEEMDKIGDALYAEIITSIGKGELKIHYDLLDYAKIDFILYVDKNDPVYNSLFEELYFRCLRYRHLDISSNIIYEGLSEYYKEVADEYNINVELTDWSVEHILIDNDEDDYRNRKTLADYARERCFSW